MNTILNPGRLVGGMVVGVLCLALAGIGTSCAKQSGPAGSGTTVAPSGPSDSQAVKPVEGTADVTPGQTGPSGEKPLAGTPSQPTEQPSAPPMDCSGQKPVTVPEGLTGRPLAEALMEQWLRDHPESNWVAEQKEKHAIQPPADNSDLLRNGQRSGHAYGNYTELDILTWARETEKFVAEGSRIFHDADELGSTVAVSCDMCHPHAANTHPETYPKFQTQLGRVVLLRDMINWCIEHPVRGQKLDPDSPTMRALEAYIMAQRRGVPMNYGKH